MQDGLVIFKNGQQYIPHGTVILALADTQVALQLGRYKVGGKVMIAWLHSLTCRPRFSVHIGNDLGKILHYTSLHSLLRINYSLGVQLCMTINECA